MIDRDRIEKIRAWAEAPHAKPTFDDLAKLCLLGLSVIDAREAVVGPDPDTGRDDGAIWTPPEMIGKRVRLVVVEDE